MQNNKETTISDYIYKKNHSTKLVFMEEWWKKALLKKLYEMFWNSPSEMQTGDTVIWWATAARLQGKLRFL